METSKHHVQIVRTEDGKQFVNLGLNNLITIDGEVKGQLEFQHSFSTDSSEYSKFVSNLQKLFSQEAQAERIDEYFNVGSERWHVGDIVSAYPLSFRPQYGLYFSIDGVKALCADMQLKFMPERAVWRLFSKDIPHRVKIVAVLPEKKKIRIVLTDEDRLAIEAFKMDAKDEADRLHSVAEGQSIKCLYTGIHERKPSIRVFATDYIQLYLSTDSGILSYFSKDTLDNFYNKGKSYSFSLHHISEGYLPELIPDISDICKLCKVNIDNLATLSEHDELPFAIHYIVAAEQSVGLDMKPSLVICHVNRRFAFLDPASIPLGLIPFLSLIQATDKAIFYGKIEMRFGYPFVILNPKCYEYDFARLEQRENPCLNVLAIRGNSVLAHSRSVYAILEQGKIPMHLGQEISVKLNEMDKETGEIGVKRQISHRDVWKAMDIYRGQKLDSVKVLKKYSLSRAKVIYQGVWADLHIFSKDKKSLLSIDKDSIIQNVIVLDYSTETYTLALINSTLLATRQFLLETHAGRKWHYCVERMVSPNTGLCWGRNGVLIPFHCKKSPMSDKEWNNLRGKFEISGYGFSESSQNSEYGFLDAVEMQEVKTRDGSEIHEEESCNIQVDKKRPMLPKDSHQVIPCTDGGTRCLRAKLLKVDETGVCYNIPDFGELNSILPYVCRTWGSYKRLKQDFEDGIETELDVVARTDRNTGRTLYRPVLADKGETLSPSETSRGTIISVSPSGWVIRTSDDLLACVSSVNLGLLGSCPFADRPQIGTATFKLASGPDGVLHYRLKLPLEYIRTPKNMVVPVRVVNILTSGYLVLWEKQCGIIESNCVSWKKGIDWQKILKLGDIVDCVVIGIAKDGGYRFSTLINPLLSGPGTCMVVSNQEDYVQCVVRGVEARILKNTCESNYTKLCLDSHNAKGEFTFTDGMIIKVEYLSTNFHDKCINVRYLCLG